MNNNTNNQTNQTALITEHNQQQVTESFNATIQHLNRIADDIKLIGAGAMMDGDYDKVDAAKNTIKDIEKFVQDINELSTRWNNDIFSTPTASMPTQKTVTPNFNRVHIKPLRSRATPTKLRVTFPNINKQIYSDTAAKTFVEALRLLNFDDVAKLGLIVNKHPLISKTNYRPDSSNTYQYGNWFIDTLCNTQRKKELLEQISKALKIPIRVEII